MKNRTKVAMAVHKHLMDLSNMPRVECPELESYETDIFEKIYDECGLTSKFSTQALTMDYKTKAVIRYLHEHIRSKDEPKLDRCWDKSISGVTTVFYLPRSS